MAQTFDPSEGVWRTIGGRKVFIRNGQSLSQAMIESGKFKNIREDYKTAKEKEEEEKQKKLEEEQKANKERNYRFDFGFKDGKALRDEAFDDAKAYLEEEDMAQYLDDDLKDKISSIKYVLDDVDAVHVDITANDKLSDEDLGKLKDFIEGQNSDGLGEGFEQQDFAEAYYDPDTGEGPYTYQEVMDITQENYDNMDTDEWIDYVEYNNIRAGLEDYVRDGNYNISFEDYLRDNIQGLESEEDREKFEEELENTSEEELYSQYSQEYEDWLDEEEEGFMDSSYLEDYIPQTAIDRAKDEVVKNDPRYNETLWDNGMTSMEWNINDAKDVTPEKEGDTSRDIQYKNDETGKYESVYDEMRNMSPKEANDFVEDLNDWGRISEDDYRYLKDKIGYESYSNKTQEELDDIARSEMSDKEYKLYEQTKPSNSLPNNIVNELKQRGYGDAEIEKAREYYKENPSMNVDDLTDQLNSDYRFEAEQRWTANAEKYKVEGFDKNWSEKDLEQEYNAHKDDIGLSYKDWKQDILNDNRSGVKINNENELLYKVERHYTPQIDADTVSTIATAFNDINDSHAFGVDKAVDKLLEYGEVVKVTAGNIGSNKVEVEVNNGKGKIVFNDDGASITGDIDSKKLDVYNEAIKQYERYKDNDVSYNFDTNKWQTNGKSAVELKPIDPYGIKEEAERIVSTPSSNKRQSLLDEYTVSEVALAFNSTKDNKGYAVEKVAKSLEDSKMKYQISPGNVGSDKVNIEISEGDNKGKIILTRDGAKISGDFTHKQLNKINNAINVWNKYKDNNKNVEYDFNNGKWIDKSSSMNDILRDEAYKKFLKEHPGSKITLNEFLKGKK